MNPNLCVKKRSTPTFNSKRGKDQRMNTKEVSRQAGGVFLPYRRAGGHLHHRYMHLANVCVQAAQFLERAAAVHALEEWQAFVLKKERKLLIQKKTCLAGTGDCSKSREPSRHPEGLQRVVMVALEYLVCVIVNSIQLSFGRFLKPWA